MLAGFHLIFGAYGFWLPNDPRGSWSKFVGSWELYQYAGPATKTTETRSVAHRPHDHRQRIAAKRALRRTAVKFTGLQARAVGRGFSEYCGRAGVDVYACAILPDHVHLVTGLLPMAPKQFVIQLKGAATRRLLEEGLHPFGLQPGDGTSSGNAAPAKCFARGEWIVLLEADDIPRAVRYVEQNPLKEGKPKQHWKFVVPFGD
jgi:REP element-mobilizing transposase RayT